MSFWSSLLARFGGASAPDPALVIEAGGDVMLSILTVASGRGTVADAEVIVNAILQGVAFVDPAAAPVVTLIIDLEPIAVGLIQSGAVRPGVGMNRDPLGRGGRRG